MVSFSKAPLGGRGAVTKRARPLRFILFVGFGFCIVSWTEPWWLPAVPYLLPAPSWLPKWAAVVLGVPWVTSKQWYSQFGQDRWVALGGGRGRNTDGTVPPNIGVVPFGPVVAGKTNGYFVELGAHDGVKNANTKTLEVGRGDEWGAYILPRGGALLNFFPPDLISASTHTFALRLPFTTQTSRHQRRTSSRRVYGYMAYDIAPPDSEERFQWRGLCIEPDPMYFRLLSYHRPRCTRRNVLVGAVAGGAVQAELS